MRIHSIIFFCYEDGIMEIFRWVDFLLKRRRERRQSSTACRPGARKRSWIRDTIVGILFCSRRTQLISDWIKKDIRHWNYAKKFLQTRSDDTYNNDYGQGVWEICTGIINGNDRYRAMYEFSCWYQDLLKNGEL